MMISIDRLTHTFFIGKKNKELKVPVLHNIDLHVEEKEIVAITGKSGSGKSTLLNLICGYIHPTQGEITINGTRVTKFSEGDWAKFRLANLGFIFQNYQLIPGMTVFENVQLPLVLQEIEEGKRRKTTTEMLENVGLRKYADFYPNELSGGQQQRVSVARSLILRPRIILADEPTGSLDTENERSLLHLIEQLNKNMGITFLIVTHDEEVAAIANRQVMIQDGYIKSDLPGEENSNENKRCKSAYW